MIDIVQAIQDKNLFLPLFKDHLSTWQAWITALKAIFALPLTDEEVTLYQRCTGREIAPQKPFKEVYLIVGRRGGKSFIVSIIAVFMGLFCDFLQFLAPGERGVIMLIATDRRQAGIILRFIKAILSIPLFKSYVENEKAEEIELSNGINIAVHTCSFRAVRGYTIPVVIMEETAFWRIEGSNPDTEIYTALRPGMSTIPNSLLISISTPYSRQGLLYEVFKEYYGKEDEEVLVWRAPSLLMNPTLSSKLIEKEIQKDPAAARAEWDAEFREDLEAFLPLEAIDRVVIPGRIELPFIEKTPFFAFTDPSGGGQDAFTLSIGHREDKKIVQDLLRARRGGNVYDTVKEYADILKKYGLREVTGDQYAGAWVKEGFQKEGITYRICPVSKSGAYLEALPFINAGLVELLDDREMIKELRQLERRKGTAGRDIIDHPRGLHDDRANSVCGMIVIAKQEPILPGIVIWDERSGRIRTGNPAEDRERENLRWLRGDDLP
jgi:hypothetical protein